MNPRHHLDPTTVLGFATGTLAPEMSVVAAAHLEACAYCREQLRAAERVGGLLLEQQLPPPGAEDRQAALRQTMLTRLDAAPVEDGMRGQAAVRVAPGHDPDQLPAALAPHFGTSYRSLKWRWMAPGVHCIRAAAHPSLIMLKIAPGKCLPMHSHGSSELTQILRGAYDDSLGHFAPGDVADLDSQVEHQPVTTPGVACICVSALDAPLVFSGWFARKLQQVFKL
ncbi:MULTISPECIES: ChrR family anti-sigma-E factor [Stenotrophomonas]|jgi:putative transcriptional regulator|uniref:ChrR family anti-sigma-E factor n=1 Tax=Stenotrophomonas TaxID=40323 RepID=UPI00089DE551|nr:MULTISPECIES: ChrR family anti-sigma-E factor [Stenotrophomonas]AOX60804.1 transcriptional regulator [Stenotrophomonas sp. LM091]MCX2919475.1 ChrR family anti-sigma-E factor [Stenotrophomonas rhizophila]